LELYYCVTSTGNFGDDINQWFWKELLPECWSKDDETTFVGIGTILDICIPDTKNKVVFGSGVGYKAIPDLTSGHWDISFVRGPITARILGIDESKSVTDSAIAARLLFDVVPEKERKGVVFMPHVSARFNGVWEEICKDLDIEFLDPTQDAKTLIRKIASSEKVLADAMHAAIIADTMRVPWVPVTSSVEINILKWMDWTKSMSVDYKPSFLPKSCLYEWIKNCCFVLGKRGYGFLGKKIVSDDDIDILVDNYVDKYSKWNTHSGASETLEASGESEESIIAKDSDNNTDSVNILRKILGLKIIKILIYPVERLLFINARKEMKKIKDADAYLSDEEIFNEKLAKITELLEDIRKKYGR